MCTTYHIVWARALNFLSLLVFSLSSCYSSAALNHHHHRRVLHQPFFPADPIIPPNQPPMPSPQPQPKQQQPKLPFSSSSSSYTSTKNHFFPSNYYSPPPLAPPSPNFPVTFPANISSLLLPHPYSRNHHPIIAVAVSVSLLSAALAAAVTAFIHYRRHRRYTNSSSVEDKASRSELYPPNTATSDGAYRNLRRQSSPKSQFLYLGTVGNSPETEEKSRATNSSSNSSSSNYRPPYQRLGESPELKPLPPLTRHNFRPWASEGEEEEEEEFFSPRGSSGNRKQSPPHPPVGFNESSSRSSLEVSLFGIDKFGSTSFASRTPSYPRSDPVSDTLSRSRSLNLSPTSLKSLHKSPSPSSPSYSPTPNLKVSGQGNSSPAPKPSQPQPQPQPPPPPPPPRFWEAPVVARLGERSQNVDIEENQKPKLKALHWDKVKATSDRVTVWDRLRPSSFPLNEDMIETLFMVNNSKENSTLRERQTLSSPMPPENRVLDPKKSQNIAILLRALNVTIDEVCEALREGNCDALGTELLESLLKMAPTKDEETKLKRFQDESPFKLGPAEKFLKVMLDIPFAFKRVDAMLYIANFDSELEYLRKSFETLEVACEELKNSRMFLKLLEAVLRTGNRMNVGTNRGDAHAFKLDTLLKLVDIKGTDGKTTLLHFVVQEIVRTEGYHLSGSNYDQTTEKIQQYTLQDEVDFRKLGLKVVSGLSGELTNVKKAAAMDSDMLSSDVAKLARGIEKVMVAVKLNEESPLKETSPNFSEAMKGFLERGEEEISRIQVQEKKALSSVKEITEYFHGNSAKEEAHPFRIFMVVRNFLSILDGVCKEVGKVNERTLVGSRQYVMPANHIMPAIFPEIIGKQPSDSSESD